MENATSFFDAIKQGNLAAVENLLSQNPELINAKDSGGASAVLTAVYYGQPALADLLIARGAPLDLFEACAAGRLEVVRGLVDQSPAQVNAWAPDGFQPLGLACFFGHKEIAKLLLERSAEVNSPSRNPLKVQPLNSAAAAQNLDIARLLLDHGADPNARQGEDFTPLHAAGQNGQVGMIRRLLERGANPRSASADGKTAYDLAVENGHTEAAQLLKV
jgi:ankyrin repeat protein